MSKRNVIIIAASLLIVAISLLVLDGISGATQPTDDVVECLPVIRLAADTDEAWTVSAAVSNRGRRPFALAVNERGYVRNLSLALVRSGARVPPTVRYIQSVIQPSEIREVAPGEVLIIHFRMDSWYAGIGPGTYTVEWGLTRLPADLTSKSSELAMRPRMVVVFESKEDE